MCNFDGKIIAYPVENFPLLCGAGLVKFRCDNKREVNIVRLDFLSEETAINHQIADYV